MLATELLERSVGNVSPPAFAQRLSTQSLHALQPAPHVLFNAKGTRANGATPNSSTVDALSSALAHKSGVNALAVEKFEGR